MENVKNWTSIVYNKLDQTKRFIQFVIEHFFEDDCPYRASALAFTNLLAIVPLMTVGLAVFSSFPFFHGLNYPIQDFIFDNFVPTTGKVIQHYLHQFQSQVPLLSIWGVAFLFGTAILLMFTIEQAMNKIWRVNSSREGVAAFLLYWAILSLAPIFIGLSLAASSYIISFPLFQGNVAPSFLFKLLPAILSLIGFSFLYIVVPNRPVSIRHGMIGGLTATFLFESAKFGFAFYLSHYNSYELLYGAFATIPIFFVWIYWVWLITLVGAEVTYALSVHHQRRKGAQLDGFSHALFWLQQLWLKQKSGSGMTLDELINVSDSPFEIDSDHMISTLKKLKLIHSNENGYYLLSRDLGDVSLYWLNQKLPYNLPTQNELSNETAHLVTPWKDILIKNDLLMQKSLSINLDQLFKNEK